MYLCEILFQIWKIIYEQEVGLIRTEYYQLHKTLGEGDYL